MPLTDTHGRRSKGKEGQVRPKFGEGDTKFDVPSPDSPFDMCIHVYDVIKCHNSPKSEAHSYFYTIKLGQIKCHNSPKSDAHSYFYTIKLGHSQVLDIFRHSGSDPETLRQIDVTADTWHIFPFYRTLIAVYYRRCERNLRAKLYIYTAIFADHVCLKTLCRVQLSTCSKLSTVTCVDRYTTLARWGARTSVCHDGRQTHSRLPCHGRRHGLIHSGGRHRVYCRDTLFCAFLCTIDTVQLQITSTDSII